MAKNKTFCTRYAQVQVNGKNKDSNLHKALLEKIPNRPVANLVYAMYLQQGVAEAMDNKNYQRNTQGQHSASAVLEHFGFQNIVTDIADSSIRAVEISKGVRDANNKLHNFSDPMDAYKIAKEINEMTNAQGKQYLAATVVRHGNEFQVLVDPLSSNTNLTARGVNDAIFLWNSLKNAMGLQGVDMDALRVPFSDILNMGTGMINYIENIAKTDNKYITPREIQFVLTANRHSPTAQALVNAFGGDIIATSQAVYDNYHVSTNPAYAGLIDRAITESKNLFSVLDSDFNEQTIDRVANETAASPEMGIKNTLKQLNYKYHIDFKEINIDEKNAKTLSEATARAIVILERRINQLETRSGTRDEVKKLSKLHDTLMRELEGRRYYMGLLNYLNEAHEIVTKLETDLNNLPTNGTKFENAIAAAKILRRQNIFVDGYANLFRDLLDDLADIDTLTIDENLSQSDIDNIKDMASRTANLLDSVRRRGESLQTMYMTDLCDHLLGEGNGANALKGIINNTVVRTWGTDLLYSFGKLSDPACAAIGDMVRSAQDNRDDDITQLTIRIREATDKLYNSGSNSEFMYEADGHILSDYDWAAYQKAWNRARQSLISQGYKDFELEEAMELWEEANTEDLAVDKAPDGTVRRAERVPKLSLYRKAGKSFRDELTPEQNEYYDTMMQIKGEIGSLLPEWAQKQFIPPQLRRDLITALTHIGKDGVKKFGNTLSDKIEEIVKVKQDDTDWGINGERTVPYQSVIGDLSSKQAKQIPIFFVNELSKPDELFKNFSVGVQALAATAENYYHMSEIVDVAEFMRDYYHNNANRLKINGKLGEERGGSKNTQIRTAIRAAQNTTMTFVLDNMFDKHFYNENIKDNPILAKSIGHIIRYTSFKGLVTNFFGATANLLVGEMQAFQMAAANTLLKIFTKSRTPYFGLTDWSLGLAKLFGAAPGLVAGVTAFTAGTGFLPALGIAAGVGAVKHTYAKLSGEGSVLLDLITNNKQSKDYLMAEYFNLFNENYGSMMHTKYYKGARQLMHDAFFLLYGAGEKAIRYNTLWAMANARKLTHEGKIINLNDAFIKAGYERSPHLELKANLYDMNGVQLTDSNGDLTKEGKNFLRKFTKDLRSACQGMFGAMNDEDKGVAHMYVVGRAAMNFRQWMVGHYSERFRGIHWDMDKHEFVRGYWVSSGKFLKRTLTTEEAKDFLKEGQKIKFIGQVIKDLFTFRKHFIREWTKASDTEKLDLMRLMSAVITYALLFGSACGLLGEMVPKLGMGDKDDEKEKRKRMDPRRKFAYYQAKRLIFDAESSTPIGAFTNFENLVRSPIPAINTFDNTMYFITGLGDKGTILQSGPDKGMDKYWRNVLKYSLPFWRDYRRITEFAESDVMFGVYEDQQLK